MSDILGFDVNENQAPLTVQGLKQAWDAGFRFCGVRITMGLHGADSYDTHGKASWRALQDFGRMYYFGYCFGRPQPGRSGSAECDHLVDTILSYGGFRGKVLPIVQDAEFDGGGDVAGYHRGFSGRAIERTGHKAGLYSGAWFWNGRSFAGAYQYGWSWPSLYTRDWRSARLDGFGAPPMIQRSGDGDGVPPHDVPGVGSNMDINVWVAGEAALAAMVTTADPNPHPTLQHESRGPDVERLSRNLHFLRAQNTKPYYEPDRVDFAGISFFTNGLTAAVKQFQLEHGLPGTGVVARPEWEALARAIQKQRKGP